MDKLNIIIFDGSLKKTPFVNRLIMGLLNNDHKVSVVEFNSEPKKRIKGVNYINLGNERSKIKFISISFSLLISTILKPRALSRFLRLIKAIFRVNSPEIKNINFFNSVLKIKPDIIHVQWLSLLPFCEDVFTHNLSKVILSQRGSHINVRPFVDEDNFDYLKKWYPKIHGFHSVSKAIKVKSDLVYASKDKIEKVIYSGLDFNDFKELKNYKKQKPLQLLSVGRPHWVKGYDYMIKACYLLKQDGFKFHYTIIGGKSNEELKYLIEDLDLKEEITLFGSIAQAEVYSSMTKSNLLVLPSIEEGIANVVIEAMAIGLPVLSTSCGGVVELITDGSTGFLAPIRDSNALYLTIKHFEQLNEDSVDALIKAARTKVEEQHNTAKMISGFENLYYKCLN